VLAPVAAAQWRRRCEQRVCLVPVPSHAVLPVRAGPATGADAVTGGRVNG